MLKSVQNTEDEKGLMFLIEGKEWNLYKADSDLDEIKNEFINCPTIKDGDKSNYKYIALTDGEDIEKFYAFAITYNNKFIVQDGVLVDKCIFPIRANDLSDMINKLANHYARLGYEIVVRR